MRINHNTLALNAWRNIDQTSDAMGKSLEKLSSGYRINRAADDPAGLVISEKLRAELTGTNQAVNNTQDAVSMIQVAEGALVEINSMLNSMRALALHAANTGASSTSAIAADQKQIDSAVDSISSIASNTAYLGRKLLNGDSSNSGVVNTANIASVAVGTAAASGTNSIDVNVTAAATKAAVASVKNDAANTWSAANISINGTAISLSAGDVATGASIASAINVQLAAAGKTDLIASADGAGLLTVTNKNFGSEFGVSIVDTGSTIFTSGTDTGSDIAGTINGQAASGKGLTLTAASGTTYDGTAVTMSTAGNTVANNAAAVTVTKNAVTFQIGANAGETQVVNLLNVGPQNLGKSTSVGNANGLNDIKSGGTNNLKDDASNAIRIIDQAIDDVSTFRANLGAVQKNVLETKVRSLNVAYENLTSSESRIRDVDMAKEMTEFTRNQIMQQAGTAMLAQANQVPQSVLKLLG